MPLNRKTLVKDRYPFRINLLNIISSCLNLLLPLLVFLSPSQLGYHFWPDWSLIFGIRVDYLAPTLFFSDLLIFLIFVGTLVQLFLRDRQKQLFQLKKTLSWKKLLLLGCLMILNIVFSVNPLNSLIFSLRLVELLFLGVYIFFFNSLEEKQWFCFPLALSVIFFGLVGFLQFLKGGTLGGLLYYLGERSFTTSSSGISLINLLGKEHLRAYSTFPHPNAFAGFFGLAALILIVGKKLSPKLKTFAVVAALVFMAFTFSRLACGVLFLVLVGYLLFKNNQTLLVKTSKGILLLTFVVSLLSLLIFKNLNNLNMYSQSVSYRLFSIEAAGKIFEKHPLIGVGLNNFIPVMVETNKGDNSAWFLQPAHNTYLLLLSETGLVGLLLTYFLLLQLVSELAKSRRTEYFFPLLFILLTAFLDHYWLTLNQNRILLTIFLAAILKPKRV